MTQSLEDRIREYRNTASQKQAQKARAQADLDAANERLATAREELKTEFGVSTPAEAKALQDKLRGDLQQKEAALEAKLQEAGA